MDTFFYFAYGSNMLIERLQARCPSAESVGVVTAPRYLICFKKRSKDGSMKATLIKTENGSNVVVGVLFKINKNESKALDEAEGYNKDTYKKGDYNKDENFKIVHDNKKIPVVTYIAFPDKGKDILPVYDWYFALIIAGALQHQLPNEYVKQLIEDNSVKPDTNSKRTQRLKALCILDQAGYKSVYQELLLK